MPTIAIWGVPGGLIGARVYSLVTSWGVDTEGHWYRAFEIWQGGLGIWGGGGRRHRRGLSSGPAATTCPPGPSSTAWRRPSPWPRPSGVGATTSTRSCTGGRPRLPWAVKIDNPAAPYPPHSTFQPTFLYECIWDLIVLGLVLWVERRFRIRRGYLIAAYAAFYTFGRFWTEYLRIDHAHSISGLRLNDWTSIVVFVVSAARPADAGAGSPGRRVRRRPASAGHGQGRPGRRRTLRPTVAGAEPI